MYIFSLLLASSNLLIFSLCKSTLLSHHLVSMASTSNQIGSSSSSSTPRWNVFLSFRGADTRGNFTGHLYKALDQAGIQTFMDDPELPRGEEISSALLKAIQESKISIVVISKNYASSTWCLNELMKILECRETMGQSVLPVFYKVNPSDVRHQRGSFAEAFENHTIRFVSDMDKVEKWRATLTEAAQLSGYHLDANGNEPNLVDQIVDRVQVEVTPRYLNVAKKPVGIASHVENVTSLFSIGTNGVRKIGIYGMGGVGKTTVAKAVYNEHFRSFQGSCFLADVREVSGQPNGIVRLQELLVSQVLKLEKFNISNVHNGISLIQEKIRSKRVLIVLDDLDRQNQLDSLAGQWNQFASGSIIMITTRDERLLEQIQLVDGRYKVEELNHNDSLELFSLHAFGKTIPPSDDFMELSRKIIGYAGGLPLALEVFGSNLFNQDKLEWTSFIKKLRENSNSEIEGKLKISFDALENDDQKNIFLDIACFFIGRDKNEATTILSACYSCAENDIRILKKRCLLKFDDVNKLRMHDLLQDLGREIARNKFPGEPQKHSRLWRRVDICNVLKKDKGTESIEGIFPYDGKLDQVTLNTKTFERMHRLRLLDISKVHLTGSFEHIFEELRWLRWRNCSLECLPSDFHPEKLVMLDLSYSDIDMLCNGNLFLEQLKILDLMGCEFLKTTGDISGLASMEKLLLSRCKRLVEVHPSIGRLGKLVCLDLSCCSNLEGLPEELGNMESIRVLKVDNSSIVKLPDSIGRLRNLVELDLSGCEDFINLPSSIGQLRGLERLILNGCSNLESLPDELGKMECLTKLKAQGLSIKKLPDSIGQLSKLVKLELRDCDNLRFLPDNICNLRALRNLKLYYCTNLETLPQELGKIESLEFLHARGTMIVELPDSIGRLTKLSWLDLSDCKNLKNLPSSIGQLRGLEFLILSGCSNLESLPDSIGQLSKLDVLNLSGCRNLRFLPDNICNLRALRNLYLDGCINLETLPQELGNIESLELLSARQTSIVKLPDSIGRLTKLSGLDLSDRKNLKNLPSSIGQLRGLECLILNGCSNLESLPDELGKMECLRKLIARHLSIKKLLDSIGQLSKLDELDLRGCDNLRFLPDNICNLRALRNLDLARCLNLETLPQGLGNIESLEFLDASRSMIIDLPYSIGRLTKLNTLILSYCENLENLPSSIGQLRGLERLILVGCSNLESLPDSIGQLSKLDELDLRNCTNLKFLPDNICNLRALRNLKLDRCTNLETLPQELGKIESLEFLDASGTMIVKLPDSIGRLTKLSRLILSYCKNLINLPFSICNLRSLQILNIVGCSNLERLPEMTWDQRRKTIILR